MGHTFCRILVLLLFLSTAACERKDDPRLSEAQAKVRELEENHIQLESQIADLEAKLDMQNEHRRELIALLTDNRRGLWGDTLNAEYLTFRKSTPGKNAGQLVALLNEAYSADSNPGLKLVKVANGMAHVRVLDPEKLGLRMGTTGAWVYIGSVTLTLTSIPEIDSVYFDFGPEYDPANPKHFEMDHASPGMRSRVQYVGQVKVD